MLDIRISIESGTVEYVIDGKKGESEGLLLCQKEGAANKLAHNLVAAIIIFHGLTSRVALGKAKGLIARYPFPSKKLIQKAIDKMGFEGKEDLLINGVRVLRRSLLNQGLFYFKLD